MTLAAGSRVCLLLPLMIFFCCKRAISAFSSSSSSSLLVKIAGPRTARERSFALRALSAAGKGFGSDEKNKLLPKTQPDGSQAYTDTKVGDFQVFDALVKYPCFFTVKAVGTRDDTFADDIRLAVMEGLQLKENEITIETKTRVKYQSMTLRVYVRNADQLYEVYRIIDADERTKFKF